MEHPTLLSPESKVCFDKQTQTNSNIYKYITYNIPKEDNVSVKERIKQINSINSGFRNGIIRYREIDSDTTAGEMTFEGCSGSGNGDISLNDF